MLDGSFEPSSAGRRTIHDLLRAARARLRRLSPREAFSRMGEGAFLVDTRSEEDRRRFGTIPGSIHLPLSEVAWGVDPASGYQCPDLRGHDGRLILLCNEGYSSPFAAVLLHALGFTEATDVEGGFEAWVAEGLPRKGGRETPRTCRATPRRRTSGR